MAKDNRIKVLPDMIPDVKFNLKAQEQFAKDKGIVFEHWAAIPSTIGAKDRGDYRRPDSLDTISENGFIYKKIGEFVGTIVGNSSKGKHSDGGIYDNSTGRLVLPKYYNKNCPSDKKEIKLLPGDRVYAKDVELKVPNYQKVQYDPKRPDLLQFAASDVEFLSDSRNIEYTCGVDFKLDDEGNIKWIQGGKNPGIDPETGKGRLYGIRYNYVAFWYIQQLINEIRITNTEGAETPARLPYHAVIQREYVYHNRKRGDSKDTDKKATETERTNEPPKENVHPQDEQFEVKVEVRDFE
jgi:hypothetical protein